MTVAKREIEVYQLFLRFILGRAGTGKTRHVLENIKNEVASAPTGKPVILLVPEQATFQAEYTLATGLGLNGSIRAQVLSFRRLAHRVLLETGGAARVPIGDLGKRMILREILERRKDEMKVFGRHIAHPGFTDRLARVVGELKTYMITPDDLDRTISSATMNSALLSDKLADVAMIYRALDDSLAGRYTDPDDYLKLLAEKLEGAVSFHGAAFWIDGFKGFTPQELAVLESIMKVAAEVNMVLCIDDTCIRPGLNEGHLFYPTWHTYMKILNIAENTGAQVGENKVFNQEIPPRYRGCADLAYVEKYFFQYPSPGFAGSPENVRITAGVNRRAEVEACARQIIRLARDQGYRWRDMAVMMRDLEGYHELIATVFNDYSIPVFIDRKRPVMHHPVIELVRSALETVIRNWSYEPVFRYLKTDLAPVSREDVFLLENYVLAHGIRGGGWTDNGDWNYRRRYTLGEDTDPTGTEAALLAGINAARRRAVTELADFAIEAKGARNVRELTTALYGLLEALDVSDKLDEWRDEEENRESLDRAGEHAQVWAAVMELLDEVVEAMGELQLPIDIYAGILETGFESITIGLIPPGLDQVVAGSLDRSRNPEVKALFLLGASEGVLPSRPHDDGIFNDPEREKLAELGIELAPDGHRRTFEEQYLIYTALTRASSLLWLGYPMTDDEGRSIPASPVVARIRELFPELAEACALSDPASGDTSEVEEFLVHPRTALTHLAGRLREAKAGRVINPAWWDLYNWFMAEENSTSPGNNTMATDVLRSVFHINLERPINRSTSRLLYGSPVRASVSRIEKFRSCPFAHFSMYGLKLRERDVNRLEAPDMGEFFHAALKSFADELTRNSLEWGELSPEECSRITEKVIDELAPQLQSEILFSTARYRYLAGKLKKTVNRAVITLAEHSRRSSFRPVGLELSFGPGGQLPPLTLNLPGGELMELAGRIDRLDAAANENGLYLRVIDYKSADQTLRLEEIYHGLKLQLLAYLHVALTYYAAQKGEEVRPGGILYFTVREPIIPSSGPLSKEEAEKAVLTRLKMRGYLLADNSVIRMMDSLIDRGYTELLPVRIRKDGTFYSNTPVIDNDGFSILRAYLERILAESGGHILQGRVDIEPYKSGQVTACRYCSIGPVCKFDPLLEGNKHRILPVVPNDSIWDLLMRKGDNGEQQ